MARSSSPASQGFDVDQIIGFSKRRAAELAGLVLFVLSGFVLISISSFNPSDPSLNVATNNTPLNWAGSAGAYFANPTLQLIGLTSLLLIAVPLAWGWRLFRGLKVTHLWLRITSLLATIVLLSSVLSLIAAPLAWPVENGLGGAIGALIKNKMLHWFHPAAWAVFALMLMAATLPVTFGLRWREWRSIFKAVLKSIALFFAAFKLLKVFSLRKTMIDDEALEDGEYRPSRLERLFAPLTSFFKSNQDIEADELEEILDVSDEVQAKRARKSSRVVVDVPERSGKTRQKQPSLELRAKKGEYQIPPVEFLAEASKKSKKNVLSESALAQNARLLETVLRDFGVNGEIVKVRPGPVVTLYELEPSPGTKSSRVIGLADDIARSMSAISARIATVPGRNVIGIELPNNTRETVLLRELLEDPEYTNTQIRLPIVLGKDISGAPIIADLERMPHLLVAGTTGSGKSVAINTMIMSILYKLTPDECKFIMIDPKMLELSVYDNIPHLLTPVVTEPGKAVVALKWTVKEMENRYRLMSSLGVRNIDGYNKRIKEAKGKGESLSRTVQTGFDPETGKPIYEEQALDMNPLPFIVVVVDEMADLMLVAGKDIEGSIQRLAQMARAAGIHIIMATQRPSVDVITGVIKANFPTRISFQVTSRIDSRTILGEQGAEQLLGQGDMLFMAGGGRITRVHGPYVADKEVEVIVKHVREQGTPTYIEDVTIDPEELDLSDADGGEEGSEEVLYKQALSIVLRDKKASVSYIQRQLKLGYNRAARLIDRMEEEGVVGPANHVGKREVLTR